MHWARVNGSSDDRPTTRDRRRAGWLFVGLGLGGLLSVTAYTFAGGNPLETSIGRRTPASLTVASLVSTGLGLALLLEVDPVVSFMFGSDR